MNNFHNFFYKSDTNDNSHEKVDNSRNKNPSINADDDNGFE